MCREVTATRSYSKLTIFTIACAFFLFIGGPDYFAPRSLKALWDLGHMIFFAALGILMFRKLSNYKEMSFLGQCLAIVLISLILGALIEWAQAGLKRTSDVMDVFRNIVGTSVAISWSFPVSVSKAYRRLFQLVTVIMVAWAVYPFARAAADDYLAWRQFPVLSDFETPFEIDRWSGNAQKAIDRSVHFSGASSMKLILGTAKYSGASLLYFPGNWLNYDYLHVKIFNPADETLKIICRIHDRRHTESGYDYSDRFNTNYILSKGWNDITMSLADVKTAPKNRKLNLGQVEEIGFFAYRLPHPRIIYIDCIVLTRKGHQQTSRKPPHTFLRNRGRLLREGSSFGRCPHDDSLS
jgi:VanZ family protein